MFLCLCRLQGLRHCLRPKIIKRGFPFMHCWKKLKNEPKWLAIVQGPSLRGAAAMSPVGSATPTRIVNDVDSDSPGLTGKRPLGQDSTKASRKKALSSSSQSTEYLTRIHNIQMARLKHSENKVEKKKHNMSFLRIWNLRS